MLVGTLLNKKNISTLDTIRMSKGNDALESYFQKLIQASREKAVKSLNDRNLHFGSLFVLWPYIEGLSLVPYLSLRNKTALEIISSVSKDKRSNIRNLINNNRQLVYSTLKWIVKTGFVDDGFSNLYNEVMDVAAVLLIKVYKDRTFLPVIVDLIFKRNKEGLYIYDLIWAFFEARDPYSLILIANYLNSTRAGDRGLACKLLGFVPGLEENKCTNIQDTNQFTSFINWFEDNCLFLYYTGESFQQSNKPKPYKVNLEAKYLCWIASADGRKNLGSLSKRESSLLKEFRRLDDDTKVLLSNYSFKLLRQNKYWWDNWLHSPIWEQVGVARAAVGGIV